jgi:hypothetical protein
MLWLGIRIFLVALWAAVFWAAIKLVDRHNPKNSFGLAVGIATVFTFSFSFGVPWIYMSIAWLLFLARLVAWHYNLSLAQTAIVTAATVFGPRFIAEQLAQWVGDSAFRDSLVFYGLPVVVFGAWGFSWVRARAGRPEPVEEGGLPRARVEKIATEKKPVHAPTVAPPAAPPPRPDGEPSILG